ncbi:MAG: hypothetical protein AAGU10_08330 [Methanosarcina mazei]
MSAENQVQGVGLEYCKTSSNLCKGFWQVLNGVPIEAVKELSENQKESIRKYIQASTNGKSIYQIAQEIGVGSLTCSELHRTKKQYKKAFLKTIGKSQQIEKHAVITKSQKELLDYLKTKKKPVSASACARDMKTTVLNAFYRLQRLEKRGKVRKIKENSFVTWEIAGRSQGK